MIVLDFCQAFYQDSTRKLGRDLRKILGGLRPPPAPPSSMLRCSRRAPARVREKSNRDTETLSRVQIMRTRRRKQNVPAGPISMLRCFRRDTARAQKQWNRQTETINVPNVGEETSETQCCGFARSSVAPSGKLNIEKGGGPGGRS